MARRVAWVTDIHLNFLTDDELARFCGTITAAAPDVVLISGDLSEAHQVVAHLAQLATHLARPLYFVLGNHDYYRGSVDEVRAAVRAVRDGVHYLHGGGVVELDASTGLVGVDGWGDARLGNVEHTPIRLNDFVLIDDLVGLPRAQLTDKLRALGAESAAALRAPLADALARFATVIVVTHVPPFAEACWHDGHVSNADWQPYFTCDAVGRVLRDAAASHPDRQLLVLCGHTHSGGVARLAPNLEVRTGGADYGAPILQPLVELA